jgi:ABC-2 type transport system permease protein
MLLGGAYLAIGQFVSATTENQILAFIMALVICLAFYGVGAEAFTGLFSDTTSAVLRGLGTASRFHSIARGVVDLRDLIYYLSLTGFFLAASVGALRARRWA